MIAPSGVLFFSFLLERTEFWDVLRLVDGRNGDGKEDADALAGAY